jgi:DinB superfamily
MDDIRYPVGPCVWPAEVSAEERRAHVRDIAELPQKLRGAVADLAAPQLDVPYREGGWTIRQFVHHFADSHVNAYIRFKLALTEDEPTIKPYDEALWAELLDALHARWTRTLEGMQPSDFDRRLRHPEIGVLALKTIVAGYGWHCRHHVAQILATRRRMGW